MFRLFFDGACRGNPGLGGCGFVIYFISNNVSTDGNIDISISTNIIRYKKIFQQYYKIAGKTTNNIAEYNGLYYGMKMATENNIKNLQVFGDSKLIINQMTGTYKVKNNKLKLIYDEVKKLELLFTSISYHHISRELNHEADFMANMALDI